MHSFQLLHIAVQISHDIIASKTFASELTWFYRTILTRSLKSESCDRRFISSENKVKAELNPGV